MSKKKIFSLITICIILFSTSLYFVFEDTEVVEYRISNLNGLSESNFEFNIPTFLTWGTSIRKIEKPLDNFISIKTRVKLPFFANIKCINVSDGTKLEIHTGSYIANFKLPPSENLDFPPNSGMNYSFNYGINLNQLLFETLEEN